MGNSSGTTTTQSTQPITVEPTAPPFPPTAAPQPRLRLSRREALEKIKEQLECPICLEEFTDPRLLPCHHSFCLECLIQMERDLGRTLRCPNCNMVVRLQRSVRELPVDFRANSLLQYLPDQDVEEPEPIAATPAFSIRNSALGMLTCPVCSNIFTEPRLLDCGHSFCTSCLEFMMPLSGNVIYCPCCDGKTVADDGVQGLVIDNEKCFMIQAFSNEGTSSTSSGFQADGAPLSRSRFTSGSHDESSQMRHELPEEAQCSGSSELRAPNVPQQTAQRQSPAAQVHQLREIPGPIIKIISTIFLLIVLAVVIILALSGVLLSLLYSFIAWLNATEVTPTRSGSTKVPLIAHFCYIGAIMLPLLAIISSTASIMSRRIQTLFRSCKNASVIGALIGAEVLSNHYSPGNKIVFNAVIGALVGCVCDRIFLSFLSQNDRRLMENFRERLGLVTIPFIVLGAFSGSAITDIVPSIFNVFFGAIVGAVASSFGIGFLSLCKIALNFPDCNVLTTVSGGLLGHVVMAVLTQIINPNIGIIPCAFWGALVGVGIGKVYGDIYVPLLTKAIGYTMPTDTRTSSVTSRGYTHKLFMALGTLIGGFMGLVVFINPLSCFVGALIGLYYSEQGMSWIRSLFSALLKQHVHCFIGAVLGCMIGVTIVTQVDSALIGPILGCYITAILLPFYKNPHN